MKVIDYNIELTNGNVEFNVHFQLKNKLSSEECLEVRGELTDWDDEGDFEFDIYTVIVGEYSDVIGTHWEVDYSKSDNYRKLANDLLDTLKSELRDSLDYHEIDNYLTECGMESLID